MRISDWSSDVCSSDLGIPLAGTVGVDASQIGAFRESVARLDPPWVSEHLAFLRAGRGRQAFNTGFLLPPLQSRETIETSVRNIRQLQAAIGRPLAFEIAARSEEHTSELQSLMRISYAVFCLKDNKLHDYHQYT